MEKLISNEIIPDVLDELPNHPLAVRFWGSNVDFGNQLVIRVVNNPPTHVSWPAEAHKYYTLCLTDPDAPTRSSPDLKERCHWLVTNIPGDSISEGDILMSFVPSCPPENSGLHRYTFVVFEQTSKLDFSSDSHLEAWDNRKQFSIRKFVSKYSMVEKAIAANFYMAQWDQDAQATRQKLGLV